MIKHNPEDALKLIVGSKELEKIIEPFQSRRGLIHKSMVLKMIESIKEAFKQDLWDLWELAREYGDRAYVAENQVAEDRIIISNLYKTLEEIRKNGTT